MAKVFDRITPDLEAFIAAQSLFFVGSAPLSPTGHINVSPKGLDSFRVLSPHQVAYLDLTGSGNETSAHLLENGRITVMFCAFQEPPCILRLYGKGAVVLPESEAWRSLFPLFSPLPGARQIITVDVKRVQTSCGMGVPVLQAEEQRRSLLDWAAVKGTEGLHTYQQAKNLTSIDGLPTSLATEP